MVVERLPLLGDKLWSLASADHIARYHFAMEFVHGKRVLDAGTGIGYGAAILKDAGADLVHGVDIDPDAVEQAQRLFGSLGVTYIVDDCETFRSLESSYDVVCSFENIEHLKEPEEFLRSSARVLTSDGVLLCSTPDKAITRPFVNGKPANPYHINEWYREEFRSMLLRHFQQVDLRVQVKHYALEIREQGARAIRNLFESTAGGPILRSVRKLSAILGAKRFRQQYWQDINDTGLVAVPYPQDFPIVSEQIMTIYGKPYCHVAICTRPKRTHAT